MKDVVIPNNLIVYRIYFDDLEFLFDGRVLCKLIQEIGFSVPELCRKDCSGMRSQMQKELRYFCINGYVEFWGLHSKSDEISIFFLFLPPFAHFTQTQAVRLSFPRLQRSSRKAKSIVFQT